MPRDASFSEETGREILELVRQKVRALVNGADRPPRDSKEIEGEVVLFVVERLARHNPRRSSLRTYVCRLAESGYADYWRRRTAAKRDYRREAASLNAPAHPGRRRSPERGDLLDEERHRRSGVRSSQELQDLKLDLDFILQELSAAQRELCAKIKVLSVREIAAEEGVHSGTIYRRLKALTEEFEDWGLRAYLK